jgi:hypothetical protein
MSQFISIGIPAKNSVRFIKKKIFNLLIKKIKKIYSAWGSLNKFFVCDQICFELFLKLKQTLS